jgi:hypothetical protein
MFMQYRIFRRSTYLFGIMQPNNTGVAKFYYLTGLDSTCQISFKLSKFIFVFVAINRPNHNCVYPLCVLSCTNTIPVVVLIFSNAFASTKQSSVLNIRNSLSGAFIYSKLQSFRQSNVSHIHSSHSSIGNCRLYAPSIL